VVKLFLERGDVNPDSLDKLGRTLRSYAVGSGDEGVVKLLLERGISTLIHRIGMAGHHYHTRVVYWIRR